jgi:hypothetical protein
MKTSSYHEDWTRAVVAVNRKSARQTGGRGFVVEVDRNRYVITAGHCLPKLPPAHPFSYLSERTFPNLLGPLGKNTTIFAECLFVDPVADIAILGQPDSQVYEQAEAYDELVDNAVALSIARLTYTPERHVLPVAGRKTASRQANCRDRGAAAVAGGALGFRPGQDHWQSSIFEAGGQRHSERYVWLANPASGRSGARRGQ